MRKLLLVPIFMVAAAFAEGPENAPDSVVTIPDSAAIEPVSEAPAVAAQDQPAAPVNNAVPEMQNGKAAVPVARPVGAVPPQPVPNYQAAYQVYRPAPAYVPPRSLRSGTLQQVQPAEKTRDRNSFYFSFGLGARYTHFSYKTYYIDGDDVIGDDQNMTKRNYSGFGLDFDLKIGGIVANRLALFSNFELTGVSKGEFEMRRARKGEKTVSSKFDSDGVRFTLGGGLDVFLSNDSTSVWDGAFAGLLVGVVFVDAGLNSDDYDYNYGRYEDFELSEQGLALGLELGKLWKVTHSWNVGLVATASLDGRFFNTGTTSSGSYTVGLSLVLARR